MLFAFLAGIVVALYLVVAAGYWVELTELDSVEGWPAVWKALQWPWDALRLAIRHLLGRN